MVGFQVWKLFKGNGYLSNTDRRPLPNLKKKDTGKCKKAHSGVTLPIYNWLEFTQLCRRSDKNLAMKKMMVITVITGLLTCPAFTRDEVTTGVEYPKINGLETEVLKDRNGRIELRAFAGRDADLRKPKDPGKRQSNDKNKDRRMILVGLNAKGDTQFVGSYFRNQLHGEWKSWYDNRNACDSGRLVNQLPDGKWTGWYPDGNLRYVLHYNARKLTALKDELLRQPRNRYFILSQKPVDEAARHYDTRTLFGAAPDEQPGMLLTRKVNLPPYNKEKLKAIVSSNTSGHSVSGYLPPFREGLLHGDFTSWYPDGRIRETGVYLNGLREGLWVVYSTERIKSVGTYRHGKRNGEWRNYDPGGKLLSWTYYDAKGRETGTHQFRGAGE
jgi:antitoxin component YwqK of YwqJK toxin-antitoxin module